MSRQKERGPWDAVKSIFSTVSKMLGYYTTAVKLAQLVPILVGSLLVLLSPTAWLSATLRTWAFAGMGVGSVAGMIALGVAVSRGKVDRSRAMTMLGLFVVAAAVLRLHLAVIDIAFVERWQFLQPLQDFYLGTESGELAFNAVGAFLFALSMFAATLGLPLYLKWRSDAERAAQDKASGETSVTDVRSALDFVSAQFEALHRSVAELREENAALTSELADKRRTIEHLRAAEEQGERDAGA